MSTDLIEGSTEDSEDDHMGKWVMTTADDQVVGTHRGNRASAVTATNDASEQRGERVYVEREGTVFVPATPGQDARRG